MKEKTVAIISFIIVAFVWPFLVVTECVVFSCKYIVSQWRKK